MAYRSLLLHLDDDPHIGARLDLALGLARQFEAHLTGVVVIPPLVVALPFGDPAAVVGHEVLAAAAERQRERAEAAARRFLAAGDKLKGGAGVEVVEGDPGLVLGRLARYADLTILAQSEAVGLAAVVRQVPERVIMAAGGPVLVVPYAGRFEPPFRRILIAFDGGREATRAVADALPLLAAAEAVTLLEVDPATPEAALASRLAGRLRRQGIEAEAHHTVAGSIGVGETLLSSLTDFGADLLVMGAYGHARTRELVLGGATRTVLAQMTVPVLMSA